jgi:hypothetical protein
MRHPILVMVLKGGLSCRIGSRIGSVINLEAARRSAAHYGSDSIAGHETTTAND